MYVQPVIPNTPNNMNKTTVNNETVNDMVVGCVETDIQWMYIRLALENLGATTPQINLAMDVFAISTLDKNRKLNFQ